MSPPSCRYSKDQSRRTAIQHARPAGGIHGRKQKRRMRVGKRPNTSFKKRAETGRHGSGGPSGLGALNRTESFSWTRSTRLPDASRGMDRCEPRGVSATFSRSLKAPTSAPDMNVANGSYSLYCRRAFRLEAFGSDSGNPGTVSIRVEMKTLSEDDFVNPERAEECADKAVPAPWKPRNKASLYRDAIQEIANLAMWLTTIPSARRHTIMEALLEEVSFRGWNSRKRRCESMGNASEPPRRVVKDKDLSRYIL